MSIETDKDLAFGHHKIRRKGGGKQIGLFVDDIDDVGKQYWLTPPEVMSRLMEEFNFDFDAAPYPRRSGLDNLKEEWGQRSWVNPPIGKGHSLSAWVKKATQERKKGKTVVMILPFPHWFRYLLEVGAEFRYPGPIRFQNPLGYKTRVMGGGRVPDILVIMKSENDLVPSKP